MPPEPLTRDSAAETGGTFETNRSSMAGHTADALPHGNVARVGEGLEGLVGAEAANRRPGVEERDLGWIQQMLHSMGVQHFGEWHCCP